MPLFNRSNLLLITLLAISLFSEGHVCAAEIVISDEGQLGLADSFRDDGEYNRAVTEYRRFLYLFPESDKVPYAQLQTGMAYFQRKRFQRAIKFFAKVRAAYSADHFSQAAFYEGICYEKLGFPEKAQDAFERSIAFNRDNSYAPAALTGKTLSRVAQDDLPGGRHELTRFQTLFQDELKTDQAAKGMTLIDESLATPRKSPGLAGTMSAIIPGSGQMYAERYKDGLVALVVNGLFIAGTVVAINDENYPAAALIGGVGLPFYFGNIYGAANSTKKWNLSLRKNLQKELAVTLEYQY